ncbi:MAG: hypothetical protein K1X31_00360 [Gemmatimonadaceae bacterium]|nr:hypothetical protein [Gemmatimonadaceae bacterium]
MRNSRTFLFIAAGLVMAAPAGAQQIDSAQAKYPQPMVIQYTRPQDKRGLNMFETPKVAGATYEGFKMTIGAAFTQQFQGLSHSNDADSVAVAAVNPSPGNAGTPASANRNRLIQIGHGFNNATANMILNAQLAPGIRVQMTSYLSSRHHNETWVKDGFIQIDESPFDVPLFNNLMKYTTVKIGHFEVNYGDFHFKRSDNGQAIYNPFVGNAIMDAFTTEVGAEAVVQRNGFLFVGAITNGEIRGQLARPDDRDPAHMVKLGYDKQLNADLRVRLTGSWRRQRSAISNTIYGGDRAGSRYYYVLENYQATEAAQKSSGMIDPGFSDEQTSIMVNPFVKFRGLEFFGMVEQASGRRASETVKRDVSQNMVELVYRFGRGESFFVGGRYNTFSGDLGVSGAGPTLQDNSDVTVNRTNIGGGWFLTPNLLLKAEYVTQTYDGFARRDIRSNGKFNGFMLEAVTAW